MEISRNYKGGHGQIFSPLFDILLGHSSGRKFLGVPVFEETTREEGFTNGVDSTLPNCKSGSIKHTSAKY